MIHADKIKRDNTDGVSFPDNLLVYFRLYLRDPNTRVWELRSKNRNPLTCLRKGQQSGKDFHIECSDEDYRWSKSDQEGTDKRWQYREITKSITKSSRLIQESLCR